MYILRYNKKEVQNTLSRHMHSEAELTIFKCISSCVIESWVRYLLSVSIRRAE
jgi:hypothetical protein